MTLAVFFPSLMGIGILVSGALLISDWLRRVLPQGAVRREHGVIVGIYGSISDAIDAAGYHLAEPWFLHRGLRRRWVYLIIAAVAAAAGGISMWVGVQFYEDAKGLFYRSPWATGIGYGAGSALLLISLVCLTIGVVYRRLPRFMMRLVADTSLGRIILPTPEDHNAALTNVEKEL